MKINIRVMLGMAVFGLAAYAAYAENVTVSTFYPSPFGSYQDLEATRNVWLTSAGGAGATGVGLANNPALFVPGTRLQVNGTTTFGGGASATAQGTLQLIPGNAARLTFGSTGGASSLAIADNNGATTDRLIILSNGNVGIGVANPGYPLEATNAYVSGNLRLRQGVNQGNLQVNCDGTNCYAVYA